ncbi:MAG: cell division protein FtsQ/DivIB [Sphingobacteriia bacterium]|nr:cell division protein FtsQ/DivIB [Sphingobacteriia bacterium]
MLLSTNEYLTYKISFWRKLKLKILKQIKSAKFIVTFTITLALYIIIQFHILDNYIIQSIKDFYKFTADFGLKLENVYLEGQVNLKNQEIVKSIESEVGTPILKLDVWEIKRNLEKLDWVLNASVARELPNTIHIKIVERTPIAIWQNNKKQSLIDDEGHIINESDIDKFFHLPVIVGEGSRLTSGMLIEKLREYPKIYNKVSAAIRIGDRRWNIRLKRGPEIKLPENNIEEALKLLTEYDKKKGLLGPEIDVIDMRITGKIYYKKKEK